MNIIRAKTGNGGLFFNKIKDSKIFIYGIINIRTSCLKEDFYFCISLNQQVRA
jgi:hypothetical protein